MTEPLYTPFNNLENLAIHAETLIEKGRRHLNFLLTAELSAQSIRDEPLTDVTEKAEKWRAQEVPHDLIINHGKYIGKGIGHIILELKNKPSSNRALYSLISQDHIINSNDDPIPSFMIFQCAIDSGILYCTAYFRALEIAHFFRINLEEMRLNICEILNSALHVSKVRLLVVAFSAYNKPDQVPLEKLELDLMESIQFMDLYKKNRGHIPELLDQKARETTVIDVKGLQAIKGWLAPERQEEWPTDLNVPFIIAAIDEAIKVADKLRALRRSDSHNPHIDEISTKFVEIIKKIAMEFRECH